MGEVGSKPNNDLVLTPMRRAEAGDNLESAQKEVDMNGWMNSGNWVWMGFMTAFWVVALIAIIYVAIRLASRSSKRTQI